jgi:RNA polymerase sigma-70 factor, ECF subfamily
MTRSPRRDAFAGSRSEWESMAKVDEPRSSSVIRLRSGTEQPKVGDELAHSSDASLAMAVARWHESALKEIYRRHAAAVFGLAKRLLADVRLAEDVAQDVFVRFWREAERFDPDRGTLRSYLLALTHGLAVDLVRAESSRRARELRARATEGPGYDVEQEVLAITNAERVREAIAKLPDAERKAIELAYFGGHTYREVATIVAEPEGTIKSRIRSGLRRMQRELVEAHSGVDR